MSFLFVFQGKFSSGDIGHHLWRTYFCLALGGALRCHVSLVLRPPRKVSVEPCHPTEGLSNVGPSTSKQSQHSPRPGDRRLSHVPLCPQMLARLLKSSHPEDLRAANKLIKEMVQEVMAEPREQGGRRVGW